jgi:hypothetical protein
VTITRPSRRHRTGRQALRLAVFVGVTGAAVALSVPAFATNVRPSISATEATFAIPAGTTSSWTLKLWSHGAMKGSDTGTSGTLTVGVPATSDCMFQADVSVTPVGGQSSYYSGTRATVPGCGPPQTIAGDIYQCSGTGTQTTTEIGSGTLAAGGPQAVPSQANPLAPTTVPSGSYSMTAGAPAGYVFVVCGGSASVASTGITASEPVVVPAGGAGFGTFYAVLAAPVGSLSGGSGPSQSPGSPGSGNGPSTSPGTPGPVGTVAHHSQPGAATKAGSSVLAFTGLNTGPLLLVGLVVLALGALATTVSHARRRVGAHSATTSRP